MWGSGCSGSGDRSLCCVFVGSFFDIRVHQKGPNELRLQASSPTPTLALLVTVSTSTANLAVMAINHCRTGLTMLLFLLQLNRLRQTLPSINKLLAHDRIPSRPSDLQFNSSVNCGDTVGEE